MIYRVNDTKNGFVVDNSTTDEDFQNLIKMYEHRFREHVKHIICNKNTAKLFKSDDKKLSITINNNCKDGVFYINGRF